MNEILLAFSIYAERMSAMQLCMAAARLSRIEHKTSEQLNAEHYVWVEIDLRDVLPLCERVWGERE